LKAIVGTLVLGTCSKQWWITVAGIVVGIVDGTQVAVTDDGTLD
jgi:hypothetical protein